jgi:hypothetical protein
LDIAALLKAAPSKAARAHVLRAAAAATGCFAAYASPALAALKAGAYTRPLLIST